MSGGGGGSSTIYTNLIPTYIPGFQAAAEDYLADALALSAANFTAYPNPTYAVQNADETDGIAALATRGRYGSTVELDGKAFLRDLYDGLMVNINPKLAAMYAAKIEELLEEFDDELLPAVSNAHVFAFGGSQHNVAEAILSKKMMAKINEIASMYYEDYAKERQLQEQGMAHATPYGLQCIRDMEMLRQAGLYAREFTQGSYNDAWAVWNENQILPVRNLDILGNAVRTILGTTRTQTVKYHGPSAIQQIAGVAMTGLALYSMFSGTSLNAYSGATKGAGGAVQNYNPNAQSNMGIPLD